VNQVDPQASNQLREVTDAAQIGNRSPATQGRERQNYRLESVLLEPTAEPSLAGQNDVLARVVSEDFQNETESEFLPCDDLAVEVQVENSG
jgi:hypothetical protein